MKRSPGTIIARFGAEVLLQTDDGLITQAISRKKLAHIACGERVEWQQNDQDEHIIEATLARKNCLQRKNQFGKIKTLAVNIDQIVVVLSVQPEPDWSLLDQLLLSAETLGTKILILVNKSDLGRALSQSDEIIALTDAGYSMIETSIYDRDSLTILQHHLKNYTNILVGQSGVGKSSLTEKLIDKNVAKQIRTTELSAGSGQGQHTTVVARRYELSLGGWLIDSPGIRDFIPTSLSADKVQHGYLEIVELAGSCKFNNCLHHREPSCAVKDAIGKTVSDRRYQSYLKTLLNLANNI